VEKGREKRGAMSERLHIFFGSRREAAMAATLAMGVQAKARRWRLVVCTTGATGLALSLLGLILCSLQDLDGGVDLTGEHRIPDPIPASFGVSFMYIGWIAMSLMMH